MISTRPADCDELLRDSLACSMQANRCVIRVRLAGLSKRFDAHPAKVYLFDGLTVLVLKVANNVTNAGTCRLRKVQLEANGKVHSICFVRLRLCRTLTVMIGHLTFVESEASALMITVAEKVCADRRGSTISPVIGN